MSLYSTSFYIRRGVVLVILFLGLLISIGIITKIINNLTQIFSTVTIEKASRGFGDFTPTPIKTQPQASLFQVNSFTKDISPFPTFSTSFLGNGSAIPLLNVYKIEYGTVDRQKGQDLATALGFTDQLTISENNLLYQWKDGRRTLNYSADTSTFELSTSNRSSLDTPSATAGLPQTAQTYFQDLLNKLKISQEDNLSYFVSDYVSLDTQSGNWVKQANPTNFIRSSYMRYSRSRETSALPTFLDITKLDPKIVKEYYPDYDVSPMYVILKNTATPTTQDVIEMQFSRGEYDVTRPQTYDVKSTEDAYLEVTQNKGNIVILRGTDGKALSDTMIKSLVSSPNFEVRITDIDLGYFMSGAKSGYVVPIYVLKGQFLIGNEGLNQKFGEVVYYVYAYK